MRISDWSSDVCSSDLSAAELRGDRLAQQSPRIGACCGRRELSVTQFDQAEATISSGFGNRDRARAVFAVVAIASIGLEIGGQMQPVTNLRDRKSTRLKSHHYSAPRMTC